MLKVVLDTNVYISTIITPGGTCSQIMKHWAIGDFILYTSIDIINELNRVVRYPTLLTRHKLSEDEIQKYIRFITDFSQIVGTDNKIDIVKDDPSDNMFISCATEAGADYIVSGDCHLLNIKEYKSIPIVKPAQFLQLITSEVF